MHMLLTHNDLIKVPRYNHKVAGRHLIVMADHTTFLPNDADLKFPQKEIRSFTDYGVLTGTVKSHSEPV